jgi:glycosyltransferase involved in cell wall biosynthesis
LSKNKIASEISFNIFGSGYRQKDIEEVASTYEFVHYFGHVENRYIPHALSQQNLFISTANFESLPYNVLEAQAMGIPVLAFNIYGINDIVTNKTGILVKDDESFINEITNYINGKYRFSKKEIINYVKKKFDPNKKNKEMLEMFNENVRN